MARKSWSVSKLNKDGLTIWTNRCFWNLDHSKILSNRPFKTFFLLVEPVRGHLFHFNMARFRSQQLSSFSVSSHEVMSLASCWQPSQNHTNSLFQGKVFTSTKRNLRIKEHKDSHCSMVYTLDDSSSQLANKHVSMNGPGRQRQNRHYVHAKPQPFLELSNWWCSR